MKTFRNALRRAWDLDTLCAQRSFGSGRKRLARAVQHYATYAISVAYGWVISGTNTNELRRIVAVLFFAFMSIVAAAQSKTEHNISIYAIGNFTTPSLGESNNNNVIWQSNKAALGVAAYFESWKQNNGLILGGSYTNTSSELMSLSRAILDTWALQRYKIDAVYEHRFSRGKTFQPYSGVGGYLIVLWGGDAPPNSGANASGWDSLVGMIIPVGVTTRLNSKVSLKTGLFVDIGRATTYGDPTYTSSHNLMYEPQIGLSFRVGRVKNPEE